MTTRWNDNDVYGHVNNSIYHHWADSIINLFLMDRGLLQLPSSKVPQPLDEECVSPIGICAENGFQYFSPVAYPQKVMCGLAITDMGRISVTYKVGVFSLQKEESLVALGTFVHVFVDRYSHKPLKVLPEATRTALLELLVEMPKSNL